MLYLFLLAAFAAGYLLRPRIAPMLSAHALGKD